MLEKGWVQDTGGPRRGSLVLNTQDPVSVLQFLVCGLGSAPWSRGFPLCTGGTEAPPLMQ